MVNDDIYWKNLNSICFNLSRLSEVTNCLITGDILDLSLLPEHRRTIYESFEINLDGFIKKFQLNFTAPNEIEKRILSCVNTIVDTGMLNDSADLEIISLMAKCNAMFSIYLCSSFIIKDIDDFNDIRQNLAFKKVYYRGQNDFKYGLLPSIYRDITIKNNEKNYCTIDYDYIVGLYNKSNLVDKYFEIFGKNEVDVEMISYIQHSIAFSPFLDVSTSPEIASVFATSSYGLNPNTYLKNDSALFYFAVFDSFQKDTRVHLKSLKILFYPKKFRYSDTIHLNKSKYLFECNYNDFKVRYIFTNGQYNDRMRYQKGYFFFICNAVIVNKQLLIPFNQISIIKMRIPVNYKSFIYNEIISKPEYRKYAIDFLYNPYSYISDYFYKYKKN